MKQYKTVQELYAYAPHWIKRFWGAVRKRDGSIRHSYSDDAEANCFCLSGALFRVYGKGTTRQTVARERVLTAIQKHFPDRSHSVVGFNDHPDTTIADIRKVVKAARV